MRVDFCLPVYNEEKILKKNILELYNFCCQNIHHYEWRIIIIINGSSDNSLPISRALSAQYREIKTINFDRSGKGRAIKNCWLSSAADIVAFLDVDLAVSLNNIDDLIKPLINSQASLCIGSRLLAESKIERSFIRELVSQTHMYLSRLILGHNFSDLQCGFKAVRQNDFAKIAHLVNNPRWFFDTELVYFAFKNGLRIKEIPVDWSENRYDERKSKVNLIVDGTRVLLNLIILRLKANHKI
ncbi:MAG: glycosyltransferase [Planctomycetes bacterium]|jgi:glycosyltransferase involved in cell wall biosynthesis|nr:glycosyltransferase [Planctomycetota bacterium]